MKKHAGTRDRTKDLQIFSLTLSQLSYHGFEHFQFENLFSDRMTMLERVKKVRRRPQKKACAGI
jgi:hypothetical protein